jgi:CRISPR-associated protein Csm4
MPENMKIVKLRFSAPIQLSKGMVDYTDIDETLHSDTLKNALFVSARQLFGDAINESFFDSFLISSAFPFLNNDYFFPKPFLRLPLKITDAANTEAKKLKKLQWLERSLFENTIAGKETSVTKDDFSIDGKFLSPKFCKMKENERVVYKTEELQRVTVKYDEDAVPFYASRLHFTANAGLFVLVTTNEKNNNFFDEILIPAFRLLGDQGIGSYKNLGNGRFEPQFIHDPLKLNIPAHANGQLNLSLFCPAKEEIHRGILNNGSYQLLKRGGYLASPEETDKMSWRKKSVYMFQEGSVFPNGATLKGKLVEVTPEGLSHKVWREGRALFIPVVKDSKIEL